MEKNATINTQIECRSFGGSEELHLLGYGDCDVVDRKSSLPEQILSHIRQGGRGIYGVPAYSISFQIGRRVSSLKQKAITQRKYSSRLVIIGSNDLYRAIQQDSQVYLRN